MFLHLQGVVFCEPYLMIDPFDPRTIIVNRLPIWECRIFQQIEAAAPVFASSPETSPGDCCASSPNFSIPAIL